MDISKATYYTVVEMGDLDDLLEKMRSEHKSISDIVDMQDTQGISLLQHSLIGRKFEIAIFLLDNNARINVVTKMKYNELHFVSSGIHTHGAVNIAKRLISKGVDLNLQDIKYQNTAFQCLLLDVLKQRTVDSMELILFCLKRKPDIHSVNKAGISAMDIIKERGDVEMKKMIKDIIV